MAKKEAKANKKENNKNKKSFSKDFKAELKKVVWPTPKQLANNTAVVITIVLITAAIVFVLDVAFESANKFVVNQVDKAITANEENNKSEEASETEGEATEANTSEDVTSEEAVPEENVSTEENLAPEASEENTENQAE